LLEAHYEMGPMGFGEGFYFTLERDDVREHWLQGHYFYDSTIRKEVEKKWPSEN